MRVHILILLIFIITACNSNNSNTQKIADVKNDSLEKVKKDTIKIQSVKQVKIITGAEQIDIYLPLIKNKRIALVVNQSAIVNNKHLVDMLLEKKVDIKKIFAPEHGFRGNIDRGKHIKNEKDEKTGLPIVSMFGKNRKPFPKQLENVDIVIFDIQDVGVRFFTYISSMNEVMEACAENNKKMIILDRPNPLGDYVDGPVRKKQFKSFVGMHPIPVVHGLTVGELALMINGEKWLDNGVNCDLTVIKLKNYNHKIHYSLPVKPSPNLPNDISIRLYPSLCFFEATNVSIGRGTQFPFQVIGYPDSLFGNFSFKPKDIEGMQTNPIHEGKKCFGIDLRKEKNDSKFTLKYIIEYNKKFKGKKKLISKPKWFNLLAGNNKLLSKIESGLSEKEIKKTWEKELKQYKKIRKKYLLYDDFE